MKDLPEKSIDLVLTSPPYNHTPRRGGNADKSDRYDLYTDWLSEEEYLEFTKQIFKGFEKVLIDKGVVLYNFGYSVENPTLPYLIVSHIYNNTNFCLADTIMWEKAHAIPHPASYNRLHRLWEFVFVFTRKKDLKKFNCYKPVTTVSEKTGQKYYQVVPNILKAKHNDGKCELNQATFSTDFCLELFNTYATSGYTIYDPFMGTGTTGVACKKKGYNFIGSEISSLQCDYAEERINSTDC
jgi:DNA modification methylase